MKVLKLKEVCIDVNNCGYKIFEDEKGKLYSAFCKNEELMNRTFSTLNESGERDMPVFTKEYCEYEGIERDEYVTIDLFTQSPKETSPIMKKFHELKEKFPDVVILFRCGDFYESYNEDAQTCADILGIVLTKRTDCNTNMTGFPYQALDDYLPKLIRAGKRIAFCDQLEEPKQKTL